MGRSYLLGAVLVAAVLGGCVPVVEFGSPVVRGRVLDEASGRPIDSAAVTLERFPDVAVRTDSHGQFMLPSRTARRWCALVPDAGMVIPYQVAVVVSAPGYRSERVWLDPARRSIHESSVTLGLRPE